MLLPEAGGGCGLEGVDGGKRRTYIILSTIFKKKKSKIKDYLGPVASIYQPVYALFKFLTVNIHNI